MARIDELTKIERKEFLRTKFGEKGNMISDAEMVKVGLPTSTNVRQYDYIERDY